MRMIVFGFTLVLAIGCAACGPKKPPPTEPDPDVGPCTPEEPGCAPPPAE